MSDVTFKFLDGTVTVPFCVEVRPGVTLSGMVRPPTPKELTSYLRTLGKAGDEPDAVRAKFYAAHIVEWNYERPPSADVIATVAPVVFAALDRVVCDQYGCELVLKKSDG